MSEKTTPASTTSARAERVAKKSVASLVAGIFGGILIAAVVIIVAAIAIVTYVGPGAAQNYLTQRTGFPVHSNSISINLLAGRVELKDFAIDNPSEFGGGTFIKIPSFVFQADIGSFLSQNYHIKEVNLHISDVAIVKNSKGQTNADVFNQRLAAQQQQSKEAQQASNKPQPHILIDHLKLQLDNVKITDMTRTPAATTAVNLAFSFERNNVDNMDSLKTDLTSTAIAAGMRSLGPVAVSQLTNSAFGGATEATKMASEGLKASVGTASKAAQKITNAAAGLKSLFK